LIAGRLVIRDRSWWCDDFGAMCVAMDAANDNPDAIQQI